MQYNPEPLIFNQIIKNIARKLGSFSSRKQGEEFLFSCPKCGREKLEINPRKRVFHCWRCDYKGALDKVLNDLNIKPYSFKVNNVDKLVVEPVEIDKQEYHIPGFKPLSLEDPSISEFLKSKGISDYPASWGTSKSCALKNRLIIPILESGKVVCYVARAMDGREPKELSGPNKSWFLYNLDGLKKDEPAVIVEGIFDCEAVVRAGFNAAAILGSHISSVQAGKLISKSPSRITLLFDGDEAGYKGARDAYQKLIRRTWVPISYADLPEGMDPDQVPEDALKAILAGAD